MTNKQLETIAQYTDKTAFYKAGAAIRTLVDEEVYKSCGYSTFDECCRCGLGLQKSQAYRLMLAVEITNHLIENDCRVLPTAESQTRALVKFRHDPSTIIRLWNMAVAENEGSTPTAALVAALVNGEISKSKSLERVNEEAWLNTYQELIKSKDSMRAAVNSLMAWRRSIRHYRTLEYQFKDQMKFLESNLKMLGEYEARPSER